jgi:hypothetical protein
VQNTDTFAALPAPFKSELILELCLIAFEMDRKRKRKSFSVLEKLNALDKLLENQSNFAKTSRDTGVHPKQLRNWKKQEDELRGTPNKKHRKTVWF